MEERITEESKTIRKQKGRELTLPFIIALNTIQNL